jgi:hypothetical protein
MRMTLTIPNVSIEKIEEILAVAGEAIGARSFNVYVDEDLVEEDISESKMKIGSAVSDGDAQELTYVAGDQHIAVETISSGNQEAERALDEDADRQEDDVDPSGESDSEDDR